MNFTMWRMRNQQFVTVEKLLSSTRAISGIREDVVEYLRKFSPRPRECYQNSQKLCAQFAEINYVLGRVTVPNVGTIDHAWNSDADGHFDVTLANRPDFDQCVYQAVVILTASEVNAMTWMGMPPSIYEVYQALQNKAA